MSKETTVISEMYKQVSSTDDELALIEKRWSDAARKRAQEVIAAKKMAGSRAGSDTAVTSPGQASPSRLDKVKGAAGKAWAFAKKHKGAIAATGAAVAGLGYLATRPDVQKKIMQGAQRVGAQVAFSGKKFGEPKKTDSPRPFAELEKEYREGKAPAETPKKNFNSSQGNTAKEVARFAATPATGKLTAQGEHMQAHADDMMRSHENRMSGMSPAEKKEMDRNTMGYASARRQIVEHGMDSAPGSAMKTGKYAGMDKEKVRLALREGRQRRAERMYGAPTSTNPLFRSLVAGVTEDEVDTYFLEGLEYALADDITKSDVQPNDFGLLFRFALDALDSPLAKSSPYADELQTQVGLIYDAFLGE